MLVYLIIAYSLLAVIALPLIKIKIPKMPRIIKIAIGLAIAKILWDIDIMAIVNMLMN